jgi:hypothetical protein
MAAPFFHLIAQALLRPRFPHFHRTTNAAFRNPGKVAR